MEGLLASVRRFGYGSGEAREVVLERVFEEYSVVCEVEKIGSGVGIETSLSSDSSIPTAAIPKPLLISSRPDSVRGLIESGSSQISREVIFGVLATRVAGEGCRSDGRGGRAT